MAHYAPGLDQILNMDIELFEVCLEAANKLYKEFKEAESNMPQNVQLVERKD